MVSGIVLCGHTVPLTRFCGLTNALNSIMDIDIEAFGFIVDVAKDHFAVNVELGGIKSQVQFIMNQFRHFHSQDCCT